MAAATRQTRVEIEPRALSPKNARDAVGAGEAMRTARFATPIARHRRCLKGCSLCSLERQRAGYACMYVYEAAARQRKSAGRGDSRSTCHLETIQE
ncbi:hypothetical protein MTO96_000266 [Rhipicephalus appendiculatus]